MENLGAANVALLVVGGIVAGVVNVLAGGGSLLTVPLLVLLGLPGTLANGTNRVGVLLQCLAAVWRFRADGVFEPRGVARVLAPVVAGALLGSTAAARLADAAFERAFGVLMLLALVPTLHRLSGAARPLWPARALPRGLSALVLFAIGLYAGAFQAGVGLPLLMALLNSGYDVVRANAIKVAVIAVATLVALPVFAQQGQVAWGPALLLAAGFGIGGALGARLTVRGGERAVRPLLVLAVALLAARMLGLY